MTMEFKCDNWETAVLALAVVLIWTAAACLMRELHWYGLPYKK